MQNNVYSAIHYGEFKPLIEIAGNPRKALFLDKILFWFKKSRFTLPRSNSNDIWFTRTYEQMHQETNIPISTLKTYMKEFTDRGLIERVQKKVGIAVRAYFRATEQLLTHIKIGQGNTQKSKGIRQSSTQEKKNFEQNCTIKNTKTILSINKDQNINIVNNITCSQVSEKQGKLFNLPEKVQNLFSQIGERLENDQKASLWGAIINLQKQDSLSFNPLELTAWFAFSLIHSDHQMKTAQTFKKRLNTLALLMREGRYRKPIGFHTHWDIGIKMKKNDVERRKALQIEKINGVIEARKSPVNSFEQTNSERALKLRMCKNPDGDVVFEQHEKNKPLSVELRTLKQEQNEVRRLISQSNNEIKSLKRMVSIEKKGLCDILKGTFLSKKVCDEGIKNKAQQKIQVIEVELAQYQQALLEINEKISNVEVRKAEDSRFNENYVGIFEENFA